MKVKKSKFLFLILFLFVILIISVLLISSIYSYNLINLDKKRGQLKVTLEHPFYLNGNWVLASELKVGDELATIDGKKVSITKISDVSLDEPILVYNLETEKYNDFIIENGIVVHNSNAPRVSETLESITTREAQRDYIARNIKLFSDNEEVNRRTSDLLLQLIYEKNPDARIFIGGSRFSSTSKLTSDLDIGFIGLTEAEIRSVKNKFNREMNKLMGTSNVQYIEHTWIYPGGRVENIPQITSPAEFFLRDGNRITGEEFTGAGYMEISREGIKKVTRQQ